MRVCTPHCGLDPETTSGGEAYERELLQGLARCGMVLDIVLARHKRLPQGVPNWTVHRLAITRGLRWPVAAVLLPRAIKRVYDVTGFDVLRVHALRHIGPAALIARRYYGLDVPIIAHHHHLDPDCLNHVIERRVIQACDRVVTVSEFSRRQLQQELNTRLDHVSVIPNGIERTFRRAAPRPDLVTRYGLEGKAVVLFVGGLKARKNLDVLISLFAEVARERPDARLLIVGSGPLGDSLQRRVRRLGLASRVRFAGYVPEVDKADYYNLAHVFVFPSRLEGFGRTVGEAMSSGLPVVASNRGALPELLVPGDGGVLCDPDDVPALARAVLLLLGSAETRARFGHANRERIDRYFRWERVVDETRKVYEETLQRWRGDRGAPVVATPAPTSQT